MCVTNDHVFTYRDVSAFLGAFSILFYHFPCVLSTPPKDLFPLINILLLKMTDWFAHIIIMCEQASERVYECVFVFKCDFFSWLLSHRQNTVKYTKKPQFLTPARTSFFHSLFVPRNLFTMTLVNRSCASSANLMSKPFLIYCEIFFFTRRHTKSTLCR